MIGDEGTVVQLQDLKSFETGPAHQVTYPVVRDSLAVRQGLGEGVRVWEV